MASDSATIQVSPEELLEFVRTKGVLQLETAKQRKLFTVRLNENELEIVPHSTQKVRTHERKWLQRVCDRFSQANSYRPSDYSELTVNASYTLAIIRAYLDQSPLNFIHQPLSAHVHENRLAVKINESKKDSSETRRKRLEKAAKIPTFMWAVAKVYLRNPDVIVEALLRAKGFCEQCRKPAPFDRKKDGTPFLEVHHRRPLAENGEDTLDNAIALCPNCHRKAHHG